MEDSDVLTAFTAFPTRYYLSDSGKASSEWLLQKAQNITTEYGSDAQKAIIEVKAFEHAFPQTSVVIRFSPEGTDASSPTTILGAHCDSVNKYNFTDIAPGADDDGSGTVMILEAYRGLLLGGYVPVSPLEFHFYAGEELGLLGSQDIASSFENSGRAVRGMQQYDMTAWLKTNTTEVVNIIVAPGIDVALTEFQKMLIEEYGWLFPFWTSVDRELISRPGERLLLLDKGWITGRSNAQPLSLILSSMQACHVTEAAWLDMNHEWIHSPTDRIDISAEFSFQHMANTMGRFVELAVAFAVELSSY